MLASLHSLGGGDECLGEIDAHHLSKAGRGQLEAGASGGATEVQGPAAAEVRPAKALQKLQGNTLREAQGMKADPDELLLQHEAL